MKQIQALPPNFDLIRIAVNPPKEARYCYGDTVYNPSGAEIPEDILFHESIHEKQQGKNPEGWWNEWINNKAFRYEQEAIAYGAQMAFIKKHYPVRAQKEALFELSKNLSSLYGIAISYGDAERLIVKFCKEYAIR